MSIRVPSRTRQRKYGYVEARTLVCPVLSSPTDDVELATTDTATLQWAAVTGANYYYVYLWDSSGQEPATPTATVTGTSYTATGLASGTEYSWRVVSASPFATASDCGLRTFSTLSAPACPVLTFPDNGSALDDPTQVTLTWTAPSTAVSYNVYVWLDGDPQPGTPTATTTETEYLADNLADGTVYRWLIDAVNSVGDSVGCGSRTFTTQAIPVFGALVWNTGTNVVPTFHWDSEVYDENAWHSTSANTQNLTVVSGVSLVRVGFGITAAGSASDIGTYVYKDGATFRGMPSGGFSGTIFAQGASSSAPIAVSGGEVFTQLGTLDAFEGETSWFFIEKMDPSTKYAIAYLTGDIGFGNQEGKVISWNAVSVDTSAFWNAEAPTLFTVPSGVTLVQLRANSIHGGAGNQIVGDIRKNGAFFPGYPQHHQNSSQRDSLPLVSAVVEVTPGDVFTNAIFREDSGTMLAADETWFSIEEVPSTYKRALAYKTSSQGFSANVETAVTFQTEVYDTDGIFTFDTSATNFVVPSGVTRAKVCYNIGTPSDSSLFQSRVYLNGARVAGLPHCDTDTTSTDWMNADGAWVDVAPGDIFKLTMTASNGVTLASNNATWMCILCQ